MTAFKRRIAVKILFFPEDHIATEASKNIARLMIAPVIQVYCYKRQIFAHQRMQG